MAVRDESVMLTATTNKLEWYKTTALSLFA